MGDYDDPETRDAFEALRRSVEPTVDVDAAQRQLHAQERQEPRRHHRTMAGLASAAAVVLVIVVAAALWPSAQPAKVIATGANPTADPADPAPSAPSTDPAQPATTESATLCPDDNRMFVYLEPGASDAVVDTVRAALEELPGVEGIEFMDKEKTLREFNTLFADQPDFVESIDPDDLPMSFRVDREADWTRQDWRQIESIPGVYRVEITAEVSDLCMELQEIERNSSTTTTD